MKMSNGFTRGTSLFLALCMVLALLAFDFAQVSAAEMKPTLFVKYLGIDPNGSGPDFTPPTTKPAFSQDDKEKVFWVGVSADHLNQVPLVKNEGVYGMEIGFDYNPEIIEPVGYDNDNRVSTLEQDWLTTLNQVNMAVATDGIHWDSSLYSITGDSNWKASDYTDSQREEALPSDWKTAFISIQKNTAASAANNRFYQTESAGEEYLVCMPFRLKEVPTNGEAPLVLKLARGSSTLVFMTGADGASGGSWEKDVTHNPDTNLKNIFDFGGDLQIFEEKPEPAVEHQLTDLAVIQTDGTAPGEQASLYETSALTTPSAFDSTIVDYYLSLAKGTTEVELSLTTSGTAVAPKVEFSTGGAFTAITASGVGNGSFTADVAGLLGNSDKTVFPNTIKITMGNEECYTLKLRVPQDGGGEPGEARIVLNYGNSPYGEIMKMVEKGAWTTEQGIEAKKTFDKKNAYDPNFVPDTATTIAALNLSYSTRAWTDIVDLNHLTASEAACIANPDINLDRNETAIFLYNREPFVDPGFKAFNSKGQVVDQVNRRIIVNRMPALDIISLADRTLIEDTIKIDNQPSNILITSITPDNITQGDTSTYNVRPDIYEMEYSFFDLGTNSTISAIRKVVVLQKEGDTDFSTIINDGDKNPIDTFLLIRRFYDSIERNTAKRLYYYRILDLDHSNIVNDGDKNPINSYLLRGQQLQHLYVALPRSL